MSKIKTVDYNKIIINALSKVRENQELCKLLKYNQDNPLEQPDFDTLILSEKGKEKCIYLSPFTIPDVQEDKKTILSIFIDKARSSEGYAFKDIYIAFTIASHVDLWQCDSFVRPLRIAELLDEIFLYNRNLDGIGRDLSVNELNVIHFSPKFHGYRLCYKVTDFA